ncbi:TetR/AcrR family transcriptional regulator [Gracilinema caldarium]|uniref:Regulatory protein TetR n=1 Tax=Gracilinema caldarium (strain ATCC 51460 / DSM 7334 / H1) TaxID=744872 RepID=F8EWX1_GRAC1|nr:TetR/AcrR family transcriptional regulator [Gracilinema caldarium]AEJ18357.1 regulatory protein TetR [Gracilinema caldarium DSM 7334]
MTKQDIITAAFVVWGRSFYSNMSLTDVAAYLGVTKPALYRHFANKEALLSALYTDFFDRFAFYLEPNLPFLLQSEETEKVLGVARIMTNYFINHKYDFIFFLNLVLGQEKPGRAFRQELKQRGLLFWDIEPDSAKKGSFSLIRIVSVTMVFSIALFHFKLMHVSDEITVGGSHGSVQAVLDLIEHGLCEIDASSRLPDFAGLDESFTRLFEALNQYDLQNHTASGQILKALANTIAELGPWKASMNLVAKKAGLAKSSLYSHFLSKEEMLRQLFLNEFEILANHMEKVVALCSDPLSKLYLTMRIVVAYLRNHQDILRVLDWVRLQRISLGFLMPERGQTLFSFVKDLPLRSTLANWDELIVARWVLFLVVNQLMIELRHGVDEVESLNNLKYLFNYIITGVKGWKK